MCYLGIWRAISLSCEVLLILDFGVEAFAESLRHLVFDSITHEFHNVPGTVQDRSTVGANLEMRFHTGAHLRVNISIQVIRDLSPDLEAAYLNHVHRIQMVPFSFMRLAQADLTKAAPFHIPACRSSSFRQYPVPEHHAFASVHGEALSLHSLPQFPAPEQFPEY